MAAPGIPVRSLPASGSSRSIYFRPQLEILEARNLLSSFPLAGAAGSTALGQADVQALVHSATHVLPEDDIATEPISLDQGGFAYWRLCELLNEATVRQGHRDVLFLGDSITWALRNTAGRSIWQGEIAPLNAANLGVPGILTSQILWQIQAGQVVDISPRVVVLMVGTNNLSEDLHDPGATAAGVQAIVRELGAQLPHSKILLLGLLPRGQQADNPLRSLITWVNAQLAGLADGQNVVYLDMSKEFLAADGSISSALMPDDIHPSAAGYGVYWNSIQKPLLALLESTAPVFTPTKPLFDPNGALAPVSTFVPLTTSDRVSGAGAGGLPLVAIVDPFTGARKESFLAYAQAFQGGVRVAVGDVTGDGHPDIVTAPGPGGGPQIEVFDGQTGQLVRSFLAYAADFRGGVFVASADINGDGYADIITAAGPGGAPHVEIWSGKDGTLLRSFLAYPATFGGGVRVAAADLNGDGHPDVITGAGPGGAPVVEVWSGLDGALIRSFLAFEPNFGGGVSLAVGDSTGGAPQIIVGAGVQGGGRVRVFDGATDQLRLELVAYSRGFLGGVNVAFAPADSSHGAGGILVSADDGAPPLKLFDPTSGALLDHFYAFGPAFTGGVFIG